MTFGRATITFHDTQLSCLLCYFCHHPQSEMSKWWASVLGKLEIKVFPLLFFLSPLLTDLSEPRGSHVAGDLIIGENCTC